MDQYSRMWQQSRAGQEAIALRSRAEEYERIKEEEYQKFCSIDGIGGKTANAILDYFGDERNINMIVELNKCLNISKYEEIKQINSKISDKNIMFTGTLQSMTRAEAKARAEENGAKVLSSISSKLDYLVVGSDAGSKLKKAQEIDNIKILNEDEFLDLLKNT